jgi:hypothetical protein
MSPPFFSEPQSEKIGVLFFIGAARSPPRRVGSMPFFIESLFVRTGFASLVRPELRDSGLFFTTIVK